MTITKEHLRDMFEFVRWADGQMLTAARAVPEEGYYKDQGISIGSIHKLLVHCMAAQWVWLSRWRGESRRRASGVKTSIFPSEATVQPDGL